MERREVEKTAAYYWKSHIAMLDLVDLIEDQPKLRQKIKTKILDVANEVQELIKENKEC